MNLNELELLYPFSYPKLVFINSRSDIKTSLKEIEYICIFPFSEKKLRSHIYSKHQSVVKIKNKLSTSFLKEIIIINCVQIINDFLEETLLTFEEMDDNVDLDEVWTETIEDLKINNSDLLQLVIYGVKIADISSHTEYIDFCVMFNEKIKETNRWEFQIDLMGFV